MRKVAIMMALMLVILGLLGCQQTPDDPTEKGEDENKGYTAAQQVAIAIETCDRIVDCLAGSSTIASSSQDRDNSIATTGFMRDSLSILDELFDKYDALSGNKSNDVTIPSYTILMFSAIVTSKLLKQVGETALGFEYSLNTMFENIGSERGGYDAMGWEPIAISFIGVTEEKGLDVVYVKLDMDSFGIPFSFLSTFYGESDDNYGLECIMDVDYSDDDSLLSAREYFKFQKSLSAIFASVVEYTNGVPDYISVTKGTELVDSKHYDMLPEECLLVKTVIDGFREEFDTFSTESETLNTQGLMRSKASVVIDITIGANLLYQLQSGNI